MRYRSWSAVEPRRAAERGLRMGIQLASAALALAALLDATTAAQAEGDTPGKSPGRIIDVKRVARGAEVRAEGGSLRVEFTDPDIVRITASRTRDFPEDSTHAGSNGPYYTEDSGRAPMPVDVVETPDGWRIETERSGAIAVEVGRTPFGLRVIRREEAGAVPLLATVEEGLVFRDGRAEGRFEIRDGEHFIGFGAHRHPLDMRGRSIVLTTSELGREGEGGGFPVPWVMSSRGYGLFLNNVDPTTRFDLGETAAGRLAIDAGDGDRDGWNFDLYVVSGDSYASLMRGYVRLTGRPVLAEKWFFGNMQSKCCDWRAQDVIYIASRFRELQLPLDAMILDLQWRELRADMWQWTPAFDVTEFTGRRNNLNWEHSFGDTHEMFSVLDELGIKLGLHENTTSTYSDDAEGPGPYLDRSFPDVSNPDVAARLWNMHRPLVAQGVDFWWQDQGERISGIGASGYPILNLNGALWAKLVAEGMRREFGVSVPVISRSGPVGGHRYTSPWPGDVPAGLAFARFDLDYIRNGGLAGYATIGADLGGFYHGHTPDAENEVRRITDMFLVFPVIRTHGAYYKLPWMLSGEAQTSYARYLQLRYRLLPYIYSAAIEAHETGRPILAPLCFDFGDDRATYTRDFDFLLGRDLLVAPVIESAENREVYLPAGNWRDFWSDALHDGGRTITVPAPLASARSLPVLVREGAIIPMTAPALNIPSRLFDRYTFHVYPAAGQTIRRSFKDRARSLGESHVISAAVSDDSASTVVTVEGASSVEALYLHGLAKPSAVTINGTPIPEQAMGASGTGWSHGPSDFALQQETIVLKVQLAGEDDAAADRIECVALKETSQALLLRDEHGETIAQ